MSALLLTVPVLLGLAVKGIRRARRSRWLADAWSLRGYTPCPCCPATAEVRGRSIVRHQRAQPLTRLPELCPGSYRWSP